MCLLEFHAAAMLTCRVAFYVNTIESQCAPKNQNRSTKAVTATSPRQSHPRNVHDCRMRDGKYASYAPLAVNRQIVCSQVP